MFYYRIWHGINSFANLKFHQETRYFSNIRKNKWNISGTNSHLSKKKKKVPDVCLSKINTWAESSTNSVIMKYGLL